MDTILNFGHNIKNDNFVLCLFDQSISSWRFFAENRYYSMFHTAGYFKVGYVVNYAFQCNNKTLPKCMIEVKAFSAEALISIK